MRRRRAFRRLLLLSGSLGLLSVALAIGLRTRILVTWNLGRLESEDRDVVGSAGAALAELGDLRALEPLVRRGARESDRQGVWELRTWAERRGDESPLERWEREGGGYGLWARELVAKRPNSRRAVATLRRLMADPDAAVARVATVAASGLGDGNGVELVALAFGRIRSQDFLPSSTPSMHFGGPYLTSDPERSLARRVVTSVATDLSLADALRLVREDAAEVESVLRALPYVVTDGDPNAHHIVWEDSTQASKMVQFLSSASWVERLGGAWFLGETKPPVEAIDPLVRVLERDPDDRIRRRAMRALLRTGLDARSVASVFAELLDDRDAEVRAGATAMLARFPAKGIAARDAIAARIDDDDPRVRASALTTLLALGPDASPPVDRILKRLKDDGPVDPSLGPWHPLSPGRVGSRAFELLEHLTPDPDRVIPRLTKILNAEKPSSNDAKAVIRVLSRYGMDAAPARFVVARPAARIPVEWVAEPAVSRVGPGDEALRALSSMGPSAGQMALELFREGTFRPLRVRSLLPAARWAATGWGDADDALAVAARRSIAVRRLAAEVVRYVGGERCPRLRAVVASWVEGYPDSFPKRSQRRNGAVDWEVYGVLIDACADARLVDALPTLASRAPSRPETRVAAEPTVFEQLVAESLASTEAAEIATDLVAREIERLAALPGHTDPPAEIPASGLDALGSLAVPTLRSVRILERGLDGPSLDVTAAAAEALGHYGPPVSRTVRRLLVFVGDVDPHVRFEVVRALGRIGASERAVVEALVRRVDDPLSRIRVAAIRALGRIGPAAVDAADRLVELVESGDVTTARSAIEALGNMGPRARRVVGRLEQLRERPGTGQVLQVALRRIRLDGSDALAHAANATLDTGGAAGTRANPAATPTDATRGPAKALARLDESLDGSDAEAVRRVFVETLRSTNRRDVSPERLAKATEILTADGIDAADAVALGSAGILTPEILRVLGRRDVLPDAVDVGVRAGTTFQRCGERGPSRMRRLVEERWVHRGDTFLFDIFLQFRATGEIWRAEEAASRRSAGSPSRTRPTSCTRWRCSARWPGSAKAMIRRVRWLSAVSPASRAIPR